MNFSSLQIPTHRRGNAVEKDPRVKKTLVWRFGAPQNMQDPQQVMIREDPESAKIFKNSIPKRYAVLKTQNFGKTLSRQRPRVSRDPDGGRNPGLRPPGP